MTWQTFIDLARGHGNRINPGTFSDRWKLCRADGAIRIVDTDEEQWELLGWMLCELERMLDSPAGMVALQNACRYDGGTDDNPLDATKIMHDGYYCAAWNIGGNCFEANAKSRTLAARDALCSVWEAGKQ